MSNYNYPKIVVTGLGTVNPIGNNVDETWKSLITGKSGANFITRFDTTYFETKFACEVKGFDSLAYINRKDVQKMDLFTQYAIASAAMALEDSGLNLDNEIKIELVSLSGQVLVECSYTSSSNNLYSSVESLIVSRHFSFQ